jgi:hypothetical protein
MPALGLRTIWIALRAVNYTDRAFQATMLNLDNLTKKEAIIAQATHRAAVQGLMAGMMWMTFGGMLGQAGMEMARTTTALKPFVNAVDSLAKTMGQSEALRTFVSILLLAVSALTIFGGAAMMINAILALQQTVIWTHVAAFGALAIAITTAFAAFMLMYEICKTLPPVISVLIGVILALAAAILFLRAVAGDIGVIYAVAAGAGAVGAFYGAYASATKKGFPMGTRSVGETGLALVHKHEVIYNPTTNRPTQIGNDLGRGGGETNFYEMPVTIETVNTKADIDDLDEKLSEAWRRRMRRRR